ncbi:MAG: response regulator transcription factor [Silicimonas sp.]|nr:response regulator transcription factor [Silicimonas sp.]
MNNYSDRFENYSDLENESFSSDRNVVYGLICANRLERECLALGLKFRNPNVLVIESVSIDAFANAAAHEQNLDAVVVCIDSLVTTDYPVDDVLRDLLDAVGDTPVVAMGQSNDPYEVNLFLQNGVKGYIPADVGVHAILDATRLAVVVGGAFLTERHLKKLGQDNKPSKIDMRGVELTQRQMDVAHELRAGKANKVIAYDLDMQENTVKVHVRSIMRKLRATNRTQAAVALNQLLSDDEGQGHTPS